MTRKVCKECDGQKVVGHQSFCPSADPGVMSDCFCGGLPCESCGGTGVRGRHSPSFEKTHPALVPMPYPSTKILDDE